MIVKHSINLSNTDSDFFSWSDFLVYKEGDELENLTLGHFCGDLMEEIMDDDRDHLSCDFQDVFKKNKGTSSVLKYKESSFVQSQTNLIQTCQWTTEGSFTSILSQNKSRARPWAEINDESTEAVRVFVWSGAEEIWSRGGNRDGEKGPKHSEKAQEQTTKENSPLL